MSKTVTENKEWTNIDYTNTSAYRTVKAWNKIAGIYEVGGNGGQSVQGGIPHDEFAQLKRLRKLDAVVKPEKGPVQKVITHMARQIVRQPDEKGLLVPKECLTVQGEFKGVDWADMEVAMTFYEGWNKKPVMDKVYKTNKRFDSETGEGLGKIDVRNTVIEYFYELPKHAAKRKKFIDSIIEKANGTFAENINYYYKELGPGNHPLTSKRDGTFSYEQFTECSIEEMKQLSDRGGGEKGPGYYLKDGKLHDKDGNPVQSRGVYQ